MTLAGLPSTAQVGLFTTSPDDNQTSQNFGGGTSQGGGGPTQDTAVFDRLSASGGWTAGPWTGQYVGSPEMPGVGGYHQSGGQFTLTGQGDIAPVPAGHGGPADAAATVADYLVGTFVALLAIVVVAALFVTAEYRRGLIRLTLAATPSRGRVLAAKAVVVAVAGFIVGLLGAGIAVLAGEAITRARGYYAFPVSGMAEARVIVGTAILCAFVSVLAVAIGTIVRRSAATVAAVIVVIVLPYFFAEASVLPLSAGDWLLRVMPAAGFALQQVYPAYHQVTMLYAPFSGYFPLARGPAWRCSPPGRRPPWPWPLTCCGRGTREPRPARGVDQAPHHGGHLVALARRGRAHHRGERGRGRRLPLPAGRLHPAARRARTRRRSASPASSSARWSSPSSPSSRSAGSTAPA